MVTTVEKTVKISADRRARFDIKVPDTFFSGDVQAVVIFLPQKENTNIIPVENRKFDPELEKFMEKAEKIWEKQSHMPCFEDEIRKFYGCLPKTSFHGLDGVSYQRKIRDEWEDTV